MMGGEIGMLSSLNEGSLFWFTVRLARREAAPSPYDRTLEGLRVLVVDDHTLFRKSLCSLLNQDERVKIVGEAASLNWARSGSPSASKNGTKPPHVCPYCSSVLAVQRGASRPKRKAVSERLVPRSTSPIRRSSPVLLMPAARASTPMMKMTASLA